MTAYERLTALHNTLGLTPPVTTEVVHLWDRPLLLRLFD